MHAGAVVAASSDRAVVHALPALPARATLAARSRF
jgi:hypothetical protein